MIREAVFSEHKSHRYLLRREWDTKRPCMTWIMLNPSLADEFNDDPTIRRCVTFAEKFGYGKIMIVNLYSFITPYPETLWHMEEQINKDTDFYIKYAFEKAHIIIAGWGKLPKWANTRRDKIISLATHHKNLYCLKQNKDGNPAHPLYLPKESNLIIYRSKVN